MEKKTRLYETHRSMGARIVPFGGWDMPIHYGSQIEEHHAVRRDAGMFDVSHMTVVDLRGAGARDFLRHLLANDVARLSQRGKALYSCMLNEQGGVIDDLITYYLDDRHYRMVVNAATTDKDLDWIGRQAAAFDVEVVPRRDLGMIAVQGPNARSRALPLLPPALQDRAGDLKPFAGVEAEGWMVARTGYTGEDGFEVMLPDSQVVAFWNGLAAAGVRPCGLGARDTLRLEAGMNLYGADMDEETTPLEAGLAWTVAFEPSERDFVGRAALEALKAAGSHRRMVGLVLTGRGILRAHQKVYDGDAEVGEITSGGFSPTMERSIAFARVDRGVGGQCQVEIRGKRVDAQVVKLPFVRNGRVCVEL